MPIDSPISDLSRSRQHEADRSWPHEVKLAIHWVDAAGRVSIRSEVISADQFFGAGSYGAPLDGAAIIGMIERLRREGPPKVVRKGTRR
jgi:hypothetical protein